MTVRGVVSIVLAVIVYNIAYGFPFMVATPGLSYRRSFQLNQAEFAIGNGVPAGSAFGLALEYAMLASYRVKAVVATAAIGAVRVWNVFISLGLPVLGVIAIFFSGRVESGGYIWAGVIGLVVLVVMVVVFGLIIRSEKTAAAIGRFGNRTVGFVVEKIRSGIGLTLFRPFSASAAVSRIWCASGGAASPWPNLRWRSHSF